MFNSHLLFSSRFLRFSGIMFLTMLLCMPAVKAQDTLIKRNNEKIVIVIRSVDPDVIKYKRFDYQEGPVFTVGKWELKSIAYSNGATESFEGYTMPVFESPVKTDLSIQPTGRFYYFKNQKIKEQNMLDVVWKLNDKKINMAVAKTEQIKFTKNCFLVGGIALGAGGLLTAAGVFSGSNSRTANSTIGGAGSRRRAQRAARTQSQKIGGYMMLGGLSCEVVSVVINIKERKYAHIAVDLYNKALLQQ